MPKLSFSRNYVMSLVHYLRYTYVQSYVHDSLILDTPQKKNTQIVILTKVINIFILSPMFALLSILSEYL